MARHKASVGGSGRPDTEIEQLARDSRIISLRLTLTAAIEQGGESKVQTLRNALFDLIERGFWRPGDRLPGEKELSIVLELSLGTVQGAMRELVNASLLERRRGAGTFVAEARDIGSTIWHFRFRTLDGTNLLPWKGRVLDVAEIEEQGAWSDFLGFAPSYIRIRRIISFDVFSVYSDMYLDGPRFGPLLDVPLDVLSQKNIRVFMHERYNAPTFRAIHRVTPTRIPPHVAELIGVEPNAYGLSMKALSFSFRDAPISFQQIIIPETPYELELLG